MSERDRFQWEHLLALIVREAAHYGDDVTGQAHRILEAMRTELRQHGTAGYSQESRR